MKRHVQSVHFPQKLDCPKPKCTRKGSQGFPRKDHLIEHLRGYHGVEICKKSGERKTQS